MKALGVATVTQLKYVVFDIETTGLSPERDRIIQIAAIKINGGRVPSRLRRRILGIDPHRPIRRDTTIYNALINPRRKISRQIEELTGITNAMVRGQPPESSILLEFFHFVGDRILVAHNGIRFDLKHLEACAARMDYPIENLLCIDTLWLSRRLFVRARSHTLDAILNRLRLPTHPARHNALIDSLLTARILGRFFREMRNRGRDRLLIV